jgi:hypothetical protein
MMYYAELVAQSTANLTCSTITGLTSDSLKNVAVRRGGHLAILRNG